MAQALDAVVIRVLTTLADGAAMGQVTHLASDDREGAALLACACRLVSGRSRGYSLGRSTNQWRSTAGLLAALRTPWHRDRPAHAAACNTARFTFYGRRCRSVSRCVGRSSRQHQTGTASTIEAGDLVAMIRARSKPDVPKSWTISAAVRSRADPNIAIICMSTR